MKKMPCLCLMLFLFCHLLEARPKIGLVLGGGGARGAAHLGVLETLEKYRIPIDCVVGTSMGALVAGTYASGRSLASMKEVLAQANWDDLFKDRPNYPDIGLHNKAVSRRFIPGLEIGAGQNEMSLSGGLVMGQKIKLFFNRLVYSHLEERTIQHLKLPLSIIATDIGTGERVVFREGSLSQAMRASMSVPGLMAPVDYEGRKLVDGGLVDNVPIAEARARCDADVVIAVNVGSPLLKPDEIGSLFSVSVQMVNILTEQNVSRSLASLKETDIYIHPNLEGISAGDFKKNQEASEQGRQATEAAFEKLKNLVVSPAEYTAWVDAKAYHPKEPQAIDEIDVATEKLSHVNPKVLARNFRTTTGQVLGTETLEEDLNQSYGDAWYESIDYQRLFQQDKEVLKILPIEKRWGPDYFRFGLNVESNFYKDSSYTLRGAYDKTWLNSLGGQLLATFEVGRTNASSLALYQPLSERQLWFAETHAKIENDEVSLYQNTKKQADYDRMTKEIAAGVGMNLGVKGQIAAGLQRRWITADVSTDGRFENLPASFKVVASHAYARFEIDQMDKLYFPTKGYATRWDYTRDLKGGERRLSANARASTLLGDFVLGAKVSYQGALSGRLPAYDAVALGGFMNLSGLASGQLYGDNIFYGDLHAEKIIGRLPFFESDLRAGIALEHAKVGTLYTERQRASHLRSGLLYLGGESPLGPIYLGFGKTTSGDKSLYLFIGTP